MGAMISCKLAARAPSRVASLALLSATAGGWQALPQSARALWLGLKLLAVRGKRERAAVDVQFHFSPSLLQEKDPDTQMPRSAAEAGLPPWRAGPARRGLAGTRGRQAAARSSPSPYLAPLYPNPCPASPHPPRCAR